VSEVSERKSRGSWLLRWALEAPQRWLGKRSTIGQDMAGTTDGLSYLRHLARGNRIRRSDAFDKLSPESPPVLIIHGFLGTRGSMYMLERRLVQDGFVCVSFNLGTINVRDIRASAFLIHRKIERILAQTPSQKIDILGHSMGGLIGLYYVKKLGGSARVRKLIMMGTPLRGTWVALAGVLTLVPLATTRLAGVNSTTVPLGHSSLVLSDDVYRRVVNTLRPPHEHIDDDRELPETD
jgi:pimeloyl-ACP methyl ester carboxylesterase